MKATHRLGVWVIVASCGLAPDASGGSQQPLLDFYASEAKASDPAFSGFSPQRGEQLFRTHFTIGKPDTPSCTTCHTTDPKKVGQTRAGKDIDPWRPPSVRNATPIVKRLKNGSDETVTTS